MIENESQFAFLNDVDLDEYMYKGSLIKWRDKHFVIREMNVSYSRRTTLDLTLDEVVLVKEEEEEMVEHIKDKPSDTLETLQRLLKDKYTNPKGTPQEHADSIRFLCGKIDDLENVIKSFGDLRGLEKDVKKLIDLIEKQ